MSPSAFSIDQDRFSCVLEDDVALRIAAAELESDLGVQIILLVLGLPVAEGDAQLVQECAIHVPAVLCGRDDLVLWDEDEVIRLAPGLEQVLEGLADHRLSSVAGELLEISEVVQVLVNENLAHARTARIM